MTKLDQHFIDNGACRPGRKWVAQNCATAVECWQRLLDEGRASWALWWYVRDRGFDAKAEALARRMVLRAARVHAANAMDAAKLPEQARALRAIPDTATFGEIRSAAAAAAAAVAAAARWSAAAADAAAAADDAAVAAAAGDAAAAAARWSADAARWSAAVAAAAAGAAERKQQIADIREMLECPWTENDCGDPLERVLEYLDEEHGDHEESGTTPTPKMLEAEKAAVLAEYKPWSCEEIYSEEVNVREWCERTGNMDLLKVTP